MLTTYSIRLKAIIKKFKYPILLIFIVFNIWYWFFALPQPLFQTPNSTLLFDKDGNLLGATIATDQQWRFPKNDSIPKKFATCILQFEDAYFYKHWGINPISLFRALKQNISSGSVVSGGSTITMQTIRLAKGNPKRTYGEKFLEMIQATRLEFKFNKKEILIRYASHAPFGGNVVGLDAAAWRYYGKLPHQLTWSESATLAVLPNAPALIYPGKNQEKLKAKRNRLLKKLKNNDYLTEDEYQLSLLEPLPQKPNPLPQHTMHLLQNAQKNHQGQRIHTSIDLSLQQQVSRIVETHHQTLKSKEIHNLAAMVLDVKTGQILAYVGNTFDNHNQHHNYVDMITATRSSGSILKPFLYAAMLQNGQLTPKMLLSDTPSDITENYDKSYQGAVPAELALARSLNIPAIDMLRDYGVEKFHFRLNQLGFSTINKPAKHYGLSLIVGGAEVTLWDLAKSYRNMAYQLEFHPEKFHSKITYFSKKENNSEEKFPYQSESIYLTMDALLKVVRPSSEIGWNVVNAAPIAWKTGTSHRFKDAWAVGVTPEYVVAVWVGNADGEGRPGIIGVKAAAPVLFDIFNRLPVKKWFSPPDSGFTQIKICQQSGYQFGANCTGFEVIEVPKKGENVPVCPYHQVIHLDESEQFRVRSDCYPVDQMHNQSWFVLPPLQAFYFKRGNPWYKEIPPLLAHCKNESSNPMAFVYPRNFTRLLIPKGFDKKQQIIFEVTHRTPYKQIFWYLDDEYVGLTKNYHKMPLSPAYGKHRLVLMDEDGFKIQKNFTVE